MLFYLLHAEISQNKQIMLMIQKMTVSGFPLWIVLLLKNTGDAL